MTVSIESDVFDYYDRLVVAYPDDPVKACGWVSATTQRQRFEVLSLVGDLHGASVLDVGCGLGGFWDYLQSEGIACDYCGIDGSLAMVKSARYHHPGVTFIGRKYEEFLSTKPLDFLVASGVLSWPQPDAIKRGVDHAVLRGSLDVLREFIAHFWPQVSKGMAFNMLSTLAPPQWRQKAARFCHFDPAEVLRVCQEYTPYVALRHDYLPNDFTVMMYH